MKYLLSLTASLCVAAPAWAQVAEEEASLADPAYCSPRLANDCLDGLIDQITGSRIPDTQIVVVGSGSTQRIADTGQSISVIGAAELASIQGPDLTRVLERLPGVTMARSGPLGSQTAVFVRGAPSQQLLVTLDGVRLEDAAAPSGGFDLGTMLPGGIGKIELLRGSNSVVWGSAAMGGVMALTSERFNGVKAGVEYGSNETVSADATAGMAGEGYNVTASGGYVDTDGISAFAPGTEKDGFRQWHTNLRGEAQLAGDLWVNAAARYADSKVHFDGFPAPFYSFADTPEYQTTKQGSGRLGLAYNDGSLNLQGGMAYSDTRRAYFDPTFGSAANFTTKGRSWRADFTGRADLAESVSLDFGADSEWTRFETMFDPQQDARLSSGHMLLGYHAGGLNLSGGVRVDDSDRFGSHWTFGANGSVELAEGLRLRASYGEGFKAPTLSQLYGFGKNEKLKPEISKAYDVAIELGDRNARQHLALTLFRRDSTNLIDYVFPAGYFNTGRTRAQGFEVEGGWTLSDTFQARAAYSYTKATDRATGRDLPRRPRNAVSAGLDWTTPLAGMKLGADVRLVSDSFDNAGNTRRLDGYGLVTLRASVPLPGGFELYGRVENLGNAKYQTVADYGTYGRTGTVGVRAKW
ncbi:TonB-dependent receptor plug domain-containing protein [Novosphingobium sp. B 225]|uniref:TonB-dependent receptor plug domain-containing protein n=1 Tax=Novosphingobium sp. B 225 TaxID=1961849 RepID=UPI000B4B4BDF|nr:TonB-dependent receptor [Novosphingobium sp. B 225]